MSTRATVTFVDCGVELVKLYNHWDGYPSGLGNDIAEWLGHMRIGNGISLGDNTNFANGTGCLVAQFIRDFKTEAGNLYIIPMEAGGEEWNYRIEIDYDDRETKSCNEVTKIKVTTWDNETPEFYGSLDEFNEWIKEAE